MTEQDPAANEAPLPKDTMREVAERLDIDFYDFAKAAAEIHQSLYEDADDVAGYYQREFTNDPIIEDGGYYLVLFVNQEEWDVIKDESDLPEYTVDGVQMAHNQTAKEMDAPVNTLRAHEAMLIPHPTVSKLMRAGLSQKQAEVQALRMNGATQEDIGDELSMATGTVKSHCKRIDEKIRKAERLMELVHDDT